MCRSVPKRWNTDFSDVSFSCCSASPHHPVYHPASPLGKNPFICLEHFFRYWFVTSAVFRKHFRIPRRRHWHMAPVYVLFIKRSNLHAAPATLKKDVIRRNQFHASTPALRYTCDQVIESINPHTNCWALEPCPILKFPSPTLSVTSFETHYQPARAVPLICVLFPRIDCIWEPLRRIIPVRAAPPAASADGRTDAGIFLCFRCDASTRRPE